MRLRVIDARARSALLATACAFAFSYAAPAYSALQRVSQTNLVTDNAEFLASQGFAPAATVDPSLINPWGMSFAPNGPFWISNQGAGNTTLYDGFGVKNALTVAIPGAPGPTGQVFNTTQDFVLSNGGRALFLFANLNGSISGWNGTAGPTALVAAPAGGGVYRGLALGSSGGSNYLYAADAAGGTIDVFNGNFAPTTLAGAFVDPNLPAGLAPFNVANIGGQLYVTYAPPGPTAALADLGTGAVNIFNTDGTFVRRFATGGNLLSPWGLARAPGGFGEFGGAILVGNFSDDDGFINAFRESDGEYLGMLTQDGQAYRMPYLWEIAFRTGGVGNDPAALYFTAGIGEELHGLFGRLNAVLEPKTWALMVAGFSAIGFSLRRQRLGSLRSLA